MFKLQENGTSVRTELLAGRWTELRPAAAVLAVLFVLRFALL